MDSRKRNRKRKILKGLKIGEEGKEIMKRDSKMADKQIAVIMGSKGDTAIAEQATKVLDSFGVIYDVKVLSAHRNPDELIGYLKTSTAKVYIAIAGLSAALPGFVASHTKKPVIGVPVNVKLGGLDALLSIVQMPKGVPVGCVGIDNAENAAHLAVRILALSDSALAAKVEDKEGKLQ
jgi:5-(carboxyamino)imidazole ribonucleotide mutase